MDMDTEDKENAGPSSAAFVDSTSKGVSDEQFIQLWIFHVMVLIHRTMENVETCRLFVEKAGIEALLKLLLRPSTTLVGFNVLLGSFLLDPKSTPDARVFPSLFLVEFLMFLAASKDNKWVTALLQEFRNGSKDVLEDIKRIHREILWQFALCVDAKSETEDSSIDTKETVHSWINGLLASYGKLMDHLALDDTYLSLILDSIFRSLRNGRHRQHGHRLSMWADDQQSGGPNTSSIPSGLEDLLVSHLRPPTLETAPDTDTTVDAQTQDGTDQLQASSEMIGSADGHDDSADRQGSVESRTRRTNVSLGNTASVSGIEASLHSVTEVSESPSQKAEEGDAAQDTQHDSGSGSAQIDPVFFPINLVNKHWVAASWNLDDYVLTVYDSLESPENYEKIIDLLKIWKDFIKKDLENMNWFENTKRDPKCFKISLRYMNDMPKQSFVYGTLDCGVMTCKFVEMLTKGKTIDIKSFGDNVGLKCQEYRAKMALMLYETRCERPD
nr:E3 ubiquitin-protein ligase UPL2-like [Tanacetum cinerariifolium]